MPVPKQARNILNLMLVEKMKQRIGADILSMSGPVCCFIFLPTLS